MTNEVRQAARSLAGSFLHKWIAGGSTVSCTRCGPTVLSSSALPLFVLLPLLLSFYPDSFWVTYSNKDFKSTCSSCSPAPMKTSSQGKVYGPQKSSWAQRREHKKGGKINVISALSSGKGLWDAGWQGGADRSDALHFREYRGRNGRTGPFAEELASGMGK